MDHKAFQDTFNEIFSEIPKKEWHYLHKHTIKNFIIFLPKINDKDERELVETTIESFFQEIKFGEGTFDVNFGVYLFNSYLGKIVPIFEKRFGFMPIPSRRAFFILMPLILIFFYLTYTFKIFFEITIILMCVYIVFLLTKFWKHKVYGLGF